MAIIRTGPVVGAISGSIGGVTFVAGARGSVARIRPQRPRTSSPAQNGARSRANNSLVLWVALDDDERTAWQTAAKLHPSTNRVGETSPRNGFTYFMHVRLRNRLIGGESLPLPPREGETQPPLNVTASFSLTTGYDVDADPPTGVTPAKFDIFGYPFYASHETKDVPRWVFLADASIGSMPLDVETQWTAIFGALQLGQQFAVGVNVLAAFSTRSPRTVVRSSVTA